MKYQAALAIVFVVTLGLSGCGGPDTPAAVMKDYIRCLNEATDIMSTVKDQASASAAKPKVEKIAAQQRELMTKWTTFLKEGKLQEAELSQFRGEMARAMSQVTQETTRLATVPGGKEVAQAWALQMRPVQP